MVVFKIKPLTPGGKMPDIPEKDQDNNSWWYFHGDLEDKLGYDKGIIYNCSDYPGYQKEMHICGENILSLHYTGKAEVRVDGILEPCTGYFWITNETEDYWKQRGLVCLNSDLQSLREIEKDYNRRARIL